MSKSPAKDFSRIIDPYTNIRTAKKQERNYEYEPPRYDIRSHELGALLPDLKLKLDLALKNNARLLDENSALGEMANQLRFELKNTSDRLTFFQRQTEEVSRKTRAERDALATEITNKQLLHEQELGRLLREISQLHDEKNQLEIARAREIESLRNQFQKSLFAQLQNVRSSQNSSKDLYQAQIRSLKQNLEDLQQQAENVKALDKLERNRLADTIRGLEKQNKYIKNTYAVELQGLKSGFEQEIAGQRRRLESEKELELVGHGIKVKRLKKEVLEKNLQLQHLTKKMVHQEELLSIESAQFRKQKENWISQLKTNDLATKNLLARDKNKLGELYQLQMQNLVKLYETNIEELNGQNFKLKQLIECKKEEMRQIYDENQRIKESYGLQNQLIRSQNEDLKKKIKNLQLENKQQLQMLKIKVSTLFQNDLRTMSNYYENQIKAYIQKCQDLEKAHAEAKQKIYTLIVENDQIRKNFEIQVSKQRARVQDLKIKLASIQLEHKQHVSNLGSKVQLTSQTLIRETEHKGKSKTQYEEEKRKFHYLANSKDKQIAELMSMMQNLKRMHEDELKVLRSQKMELRSEVQQVEAEIKRIRDAADQQAKLKDERLKNLVTSNQKQIQQIKELQDKIQILEKNNIKQKKQLDHIQLINSSLAQELGLSKGFIESLQLESNAAIEDERNKLKVFLGSHEVSLREYFEDKLKSREKDAENLQRLLSEKEGDIRDLIVKYNALERRLQMMLEAQEKVREFQERVKSLGLDNNLIKNMAELFKK